MPSKGSLKIGGHSTCVEVDGVSKGTWQLRFTDPCALLVDLNDLARLLQAPGCSIIKAVSVQDDGTLLIFQQERSPKMRGMDILHLAGLRFKKTNVRTSESRTTGREYVNRRGLQGGVSA